MRHHARTQSFSRPYNQRKWLMRNLVVNLVEHERIKTTLAKAKELRRLADRAVTLGKRGGLADRRLLFARIPHYPTVEKVFRELAPRFKDRTGGYTRVLKLGWRAGDCAEMAFIEFLDPQLKRVSKEVEKDAKKAKAKLAGGAKKAKSSEAAGEKKAKSTSQKKVSKAEAKETKSSKSKA